MRFQIQREALLKPLQIASGVVERRQTLPILSNVLVEVRGDTLTVTGTDLEVELKAFARIENATNGDITLPARKWVDICRALPDGTLIDVSVDETKAQVKGGRSRFSLATLPANDYPAADAVSGGMEIQVPAAVLKRLLDKTQFCMANQDVRYYLNGMLLELEGNRITAVATDGHRLAVSHAETQITAGVKHQVIVPRKGVLELGKLLGEGDELVTLRMNNNHLRVEHAGVVLTSKLIDGRFPDYERVVPKQSTRIVLADRETLKQALVRAAILSNEKFRGVRLQVEKDRLKALVSNPDQEMAEEEVDIRYDGSEFEIGFNVSYLIDALNAIDGNEVEIGFTDANSSCLVRDVTNAGSRYVVMPMRL